MPDLPTHPYLTVLVRKLPGSTDVRPYFSKCRHSVSRKYGNRDMKDCEFIAIVERWWGIIVRWHLHIFQAISGAEVYSWSWLVKQVLQTSEHQLCIKTLVKLAIFLYGRFEFKAVGDKWLHKTDEEEEECSKPRKQTDTSASAKAAHTVHCFRRKCSALFGRERL